jgi:hypothetical protein
MSGIWKEFEKTKKMGPTLGFLLKPFRNGGQLKIRYEKLN